MLTKADIELLRNLKEKKHRNIHGLFVAEGPKLILDFIASGLVLKRLYTVDMQMFNVPGATEIAAAELKRISSRKTPNTAVAIFKIPPVKLLQQKGLILALDNVNDPGNLGTIIRLCHWFGVTQLVCGKNTADCYNAKVVQSSMGALAGVSVHYLNLPEFLSTVEMPVFGAVLDGLDVRTLPGFPDAVIVMGSEASGISKEVMKGIKTYITIPGFGSKNKPESLNVASATAIILHEFRAKQTFARD